MSDTKTANVGFIDDVGDRVKRSFRTRVADPGQPREEVKGEK